MTGGRVKGLHAADHGHGLDVTAAAHEDAVRIALAAAGPDRIALVIDATPAAE